MGESNSTLMINKVIQGDCLEVMKDIPDKSIDMILCDLPYGTTTCKWDTIIPFEPLWEQYNRVIKDNGAIVLTASQPFTSAMVMSNPKKFKYEWIWEKTKPVGFLNAKKMPLKDVEHIIIFGGNKINYFPQGLLACNKTNSNSTKTIKGRNPTAINGGRMKDKEYLQVKTNYPRQVLRFGIQHGLHPTQKPVALFEYLIKTYTNEGDTVLDNAAGSCTTAVACLKTNRKYICIEKEDEYIKVCHERIATITNPTSCGDN